MNETDFSDITRLSDKFNKDPKSRIFVQLADVYRKNNMVEEALDVLNKGLQHHSEYPVAYLILGKCHYDKRSYIQAKDAFEKTIDLDPQNIVALRMLAKTCEILKDEKGQINAYKSIVSIDPMDSTAHEKLSMLEALQRKEPLYTVAMAEEYEKQGNLKEALKIYENLLFTDPSDLVLNQKVAALKKSIDEEKRRIEEEKIEDLQIERVFKTEELPAAEPAEKVEIPSVSDTGTEEKASTIQNDIQSLEDFLVEELEQAAEKVAAQPTGVAAQPIEAEKEPTEEEPGREETPTPLLDLQPEQGMPADDVPEELPEPKPPEPETMPPEIELATFEPKPEPVPAAPMSAEPESEAPVPADESQEQTPSETTFPEFDIQMPLPVDESMEPPPTVTSPPEIEEKPAAPPVAETTPPAEEIAPATPPVSEETTVEEVKEEPPEKSQPPETEQEPRKKEEQLKTKEEDFKSFQEWLSGLLK